MKDTLTYKGYSGSIKVSVSDNCLHGSLLFIDDKVTYEGSTPKELEDNFKEAVDGYIELCKEIGDEPQAPYKGTFNVRIGSELHRLASIKAYQNDLSLNQFVKDAVTEKLASNSPAVVKHVHEHTHNVVIDGLEYSTALSHGTEGIGEERWQQKNLRVTSSH